MFSVEKISSTISEKLSKELNYDDEKKAIINYGIFSFMQIIFSIIAVIIFGSIFNVLIESLIVSFSISILRKSSGGVHASTPEGCLIVGTGISILLALISKGILLNLKFNVYFGILTFILAYILVFMLAPVDSKNKPIKTEKKRKRLKKSSILILTFYLIVVIGSLLINGKTDNINMLIYNNCMYLAISWQVFSLTAIGHRVLGKLDTLFK